MTHVHSHMLCADCGTLVDRNANTPQTKHACFVYWPDTGEGPYFMCSMCAQHSCKNRGAREVANDALAQLWLRYDLEYENGTLVKVDGMRPEYMDGHKLIALAKAMAAALPRKKENRRGY